MMLSDDILAAFYIVRSDLVSCCRGRFYYTRSCKITFHTLAKGKNLCEKKFVEKSVNGN